MLGDKVKELESRRSENALLSSFISLDMLSRLKIWKDERNSLMHQLADNALPWDELNKEIENVAVSGWVLAREFATKARSLKRSTKVIQNKEQIDSTGISMPND